MLENQTVWWKVQILSNGVAIDDSVVRNYDSKFIEKRSAYGVQDPSEYHFVRIPQELIIMPEELVCAVNINPRSSYILKYSVEQKYYYIENMSFGSKRIVSFPKRPAFYEKTLVYNPTLKANQIISLYGGHSLGAFLIRNCWFENNGVCHFCSLCNNHGINNDFLNIIDSDVLVESIEMALSENYPITQIMLNGGNLSSLDENFNFYVERVLAVRKLLDRLKRSDIELHLIISPPRDLELLEILRFTKIKIAMNMEAYDEQLFFKYCPGKSRHIGHEHLLKALKKSVDVLGNENVYSIFVGGLEPLETLEKGISVMIDNGIVPVINVLHIDPNTFMKESQRPSSEYIMNAGKILQNAYSNLSPNFRPFYRDCGRNSLDTEAYRKLFEY